MCVPSGSSIVVDVELLFVRMDACFVCSSVPFAAESASHGMLMLLLCCCAGGGVDSCVVLWWVLLITSFLSGLLVILLLLLLLLATTTYYLAAGCSWVLRARFSVGAVLAAAVWVFGGCCLNVAFFAPLALCACVVGVAVRPAVGTVCSLGFVAVSVAVAVVGAAAVAFLEGRGEFFDLCTERTDLGFLGAARGLVAGAHAVGC